MGAIGGWIKVLVGFFVLGATFIMMDPLYSFEYALASAFGGNALKVANLIKACISVSPVLIAITLILWGFVQTLRDEDNSQIVRRW